MTLSRAAPELAAKPVASAAPSVDRGVDLILAALFFVSGFAAILYQLVWQRMLYVLVGINVEAVTLIVTVFIAGLGLGSLAGGAASHLRAGQLVATFAAVELSIGLFGAASPWLFGILGTVAPRMGPVATALSVAALVLPPTMAMGATLPILVTNAVRRRASVGVAVGTLYCVNTLGSAIAAFAAGLLLMRWLGQSGVLALAATSNLLVASIALITLRRLSR